MVRTLSISLCCGVCFSCSLLLAQSAPPVEADSVERTYILDEILVRGTRAEVPTSSTTEYGAGELASSAAHSVAEVLRSEPALSVTTGAKAETETKIRGFPAYGVLVRIDGHPVNPGYYGKVDLSLLPVENIEAMRVIKGPAAVAYGANGMGGIIDITTRRTSGEPATDMAMAFGGNGYRNLSAGHSNRIGIVRFWLSGYEHRSDGYPLSDAFVSTGLEDGGARNHSAYRKAGGNLRLGIQPGQDVSASLSLGYHWARKDVPSTVYSWDSPTYREFPEYVRSNISLYSQWLPSPRLLLSALVYYDGYRDRLLDFRTSAREVTDLNYDSYLGSQTLGATLEAALTLAEVHSIRAGVNAAQDRMEKQSDTDLPYERHRLTGGYLYVQDTYRPSGDLYLVGGCIASFSEREQSGASDVSPMLSARYRLPYEFYVKASYAGAIRYPALHHLYSEASGNPALLPEKADKWEAGLEKTMSFQNPALELSLECAVFHNDLRNLIYRTGSSYRYKNIAATVIRGMELWSRCTVFETMTLDIGYMALDREATSPEIMEEVSPQTLRIQLAVRTEFGLHASYEFRDVGDRTTYYAARNLAPYRVHIIRVSQAVFERLRATVEVQNAGDTDYEDELGYPAPGRQYIAGISYSF